MLLYSLNLSLDVKNKDISVGGLEKLKSFVAWSIKEYFKDRLSNDIPSYSYFRNIMNRIYSELHQRRMVYVVDKPGSGMTQLYQVFIKELIGCLDSKFEVVYLSSKKITNIRDFRAAIFDQLNKIINFEQHDITSSKLIDEKYPFFSKFDQLIDNSLEKEVLIIIDKFPPRLQKEIIESISPVIVSSKFKFLVFLDEYRPRNRFLAFQQPSIIPVKNIYTVYVSQIIEEGSLKCKIKIYGLFITLFVGIGGYGDFRSGIRQIEADLRWLSEIGMEIVTRIDPDKLLRIRNFDVRQNKVLEDLQSHMNLYLEGEIDYNQFKYLSQKSLESIKKFKDEKEAVLKLLPHIQEDRNHHSENDHSEEKSKHSNDRYAILRDEDRKKYLI